MQTLNNKTPTKVELNKIILVSFFVFGTRSLLFCTHTSVHLEIATTEYTRSHDRSENGDSIFVRKVFGFISQDIVALMFMSSDPEIYTQYSNFLTSQETEFRIDMARQNDMLNITFRLAVGPK